MLIARASHDPLDTPQVLSYSCLLGTIYSYTPITSSSGPYLDPPNSLPSEARDCALGRRQGQAQFVALDEGQGIPNALILGEAV